MFESTFAMFLHHAPHPSSRQSSSPVEPAEYPARAARQWIPQVSRQSSSPVDPAAYPARAARQYIPLSIPPERLAMDTRRDTLASYSEILNGILGGIHWRAALVIYLAGSIPCRAEYPASIEPERLASIRQWTPPVSRQSSSPVWFCLMSKRADGNLESKSLECGGICWNGCVSVEGGDCSNRNNLFSG